MKCSVWKSTGKEFTYVYLAEDHQFDDLPIALRKAFGNRNGSWTWNWRLIENWLMKTSTW